jgi:hypothetical protein
MIHHSTNGLQNHLGADRPMHRMTYTSWTPKLDSGPLMGCNPSVPHSVPRRLRMAQAHSGDIRRQSPGVGADAHLWFVGTGMRPSIRPPGAWWRRGTRGRDHVYSTMRYISRFGDWVSIPDIRSLHCWNSVVSVTCLIWASSIARSAASYSKTTSAAPAEAKWLRRARARRPPT